MWCLFAGLWWNWALQASVWHDGSGIGASWFLETLVVTHGDSQRAWKFDFSGWMPNRQAKATAVKPILLQVCV